MNYNFKLIASLLIFQLARFGLLVSFLSSSLQSYLMCYCLGIFYLEMIVLKKVFGKFGINVEAKDQNGKAQESKIILMVALLCSTPLAVAVPLINLTSSTIPTGPSIGPVELENWNSMKPGNSFEIVDAHPHIKFLGAVKYALNARVKEFFYAVPMESKEWNPDETIRAWLILGEYDLNHKEKLERKYALAVSPENVHYRAFSKAVQNAEERFNLKSRENFVMIRMLAEVPDSGSIMNSQSRIILAIYVGMWLLVIPFVLNKSKADNSGNELLNPVVKENERNSSRDLSIASIYITSRKGWFVIHVMGYIIFAIWMYHSTIAWLPFIAAFMLPCLEFWLIIRNYPDAESRKSGRLALKLMVMPVAVCFSYLLLGVGAFSISDRHLAEAAVEVNSDAEVFPTENSCWKFADKPVIRNDLSGIFWAPTEFSKYTSVIPVVSQNWNIEEPVRIWIVSDDREETRYEGKSLGYVKHVNQVNYRTELAMKDALNYHQLKSAPNAVFLTRINSPEENSSQGGGFILLGFMGCLLSWILCACFWPMPPIMQNFNPQN